MNYELNPYHPVIFNAACKTKESFESMNSIERVLAAIELRPPNHVPVDLHNFQTAAYATGLPLSEVFRRGELLAEAMLKAWREFGKDKVLARFCNQCFAPTLTNDSASFM